MSSIVTYEYICRNPDIRTYIKNADAAVEAQGYTEHSFAHVEKSAATVEMILSTLNYPARTIELGKIAAYLHDIGNVINRIDHAQSGAVMAFRLLDNLNMPAEEICAIVSAIADKTDVRRSRVRNADMKSFDIHDRVNYAVEKSDLFFGADKTSLILELEIDTNIASVMEYFEIFLQRMMLCKRSAEFLGVKFRLRINGGEII